MINSVNGIKENSGKVTSRNWIETCLKQIAKKLHKDYEYLLSLYNSIMNKARRSFHFDPSSYYLLPKPEGDF